MLFPSWAEKPSEFVESVWITAKMSELSNLTLLSPGSRIVVSYLGEPDPFFERMSDGLVDGGICWGAHWCDWKSILEDLGKVAGLSDVTEQSGYPRNVV